MSKTGEVEWSEEVYRIFRRDPEEFTPQIDSIMALSPWPEDHERDQELINRALSNREQGCYEQRFLRPDGSTGYYYSTFQGIYDDAGELVAIKGTVQDITERKQAEGELASAKSFLDTIVDMSPFAMWVADPEGTVIRTNRSLRQTLNLTGRADPRHIQRPRRRKSGETGRHAQVRDVFKEHNRRVSVFPGRRPRPEMWLSKAGEICTSTYPCFRC